MANGVNDLRLISGKEAIALEPELRCQAALLSPSTGIVSSHALMECLLADAQSHGAALVLGSSVVGGSVEGSTEAASSPPSPSPSSSAPSSSCPSSSSASPAASDDVASSSSSSCSSVGGGTAVRSAASDNAGHLQLAIQELATGQVQRVEAKYVINSAGKHMRLSFTATIRCLAAAVRWQSMTCAAYSQAGCRRGGRLPCFQLGGCAL